ncbi:MAG: YetF domain-containing protein [Cyanobacteria bacterium P01_A01_bin.135]
MDILGTVFDGWEGILKVLLAAPIMYAAVVLAVRITGKRATSQMNNFDWIVTVAVGALTASGIVSDSVTVAEALTAIACLLAAQYASTRGVFMSNRFTRVVKASPALLVHGGQFIYDAMRRERVTKSEIMAAIREHGLIDVEDVQWVVLETDATLSVIPKDGRDFSQANFEDVSGFPQQK